MEKVVSCCGVICADCPKYGESCAGCARIEGRVYWLRFTGDSVCGVYGCCVQEKKLAHCGQCPDLPCDLFVEDPTVSKEVNALNHKKQLENLQSLHK